MYLLCVGAFYLLVWILLVVKGVIVPTGQHMFFVIQIAFAAVVLVILNVLSGRSPGWRHLMLRITYIFPATLLLGDMYIRYVQYHGDGIRNYGAWEFVLDLILLPILYTALFQLSESPPDNDSTTIYRSYPPTAFWGWLLPFSLFKMVRIWPMVEPVTKGSICSWYVVLHALLLIGILLGWWWQRRFKMNVWAPPFILSGIVFFLATVIYYVVVYEFGWNPLSPFP